MDTFVTVLVILAMIALGTLAIHMPTPRLLSCSSRTQAISRLFPARPF